MKKMSFFMVLVMLLLAGCGGTEQSDAVQEISGTELRGSIQRLTPEVEGGNSGIIYRNTAFGFGCVLNENWLYADDSGLEARKEVSIAAAEKAVLDDADFFVDFYAYAEDESASVEVIVENMGVLYGAVWDEEQYLRNSLKKIESYLEETEMEYGTAEEDDIDLGGEERKSIRVTGSVQDVPLYQRQVYIKNGDYMAILSVTCYQIDISDAILELFFTIS